MPRRRRRWRRARTRRWLPSAPRGKTMLLPTNGGPTSSSASARPGFHDQKELCVTTRVKIAAVAVVSAGLIALGAFAVSVFQNGDQDRGPIIVRGGSIRMENGEGNNGKKWKENGNKKSWRSDHSHGAAAVSFTVGVSQATGPAAPSSPCPSMAMTGTKVVIEYTTDAGVKSQVTVSLGLDG